VKDIRKEVIEKEGKPMPDADIVERLKERGIHIARRTVAKYRMQFAHLAVRAALGHLSARQNHPLAGRVADTHVQDHQVRTAVVRNPLRTCGWRTRQGDFHPSESMPPVGKDLRKGRFRSFVEAPIRGLVMGTSDGPTSACPPGRMAC
jgi:hypothetical protein